MTNRRIAQLTGAAGAAGLLAGMRSRTGGGIVLGYHDVTADGMERTQYDVSASRFREHMVLLRRWGLELVPLERIVALLAAGQPVDRLVGVTFDDSLEGVHHHALPVLVELEVPATIFTVSGYLGRSPSWWADAGRIMSERELLETREAGVTIASHSVGHPSLPTLATAALRDEVAGSKAQLEDLTGAPVDLLAYPFGHHDPAVREAAADAGYTAGFSFLNGRVTVGDDMFKLPRFTMTAAHTRSRLAYHVARPVASWPDTAADAVLGDP